MHGNIVILWVLFHNSCWMQNMSNAEHASNTKVLGSNWRSFMKM